MEAASQLRTPKEVSLSVVEVLALEVISTRYFRTLCSFLAASKMSLTRSLKS
jgi:hypothetical protein